MQDTGSRPTAAVLLVGNELLSGRVADENLTFLARRLFELGVPLCRAEVCRDEPGEIAQAVARLSPLVTWVFTTGGVGPTHDDVTMEGVAGAFGVRVVVEPTLETLVREHFGADCTPAHLRLAWAPAGAALEGGGAGWPTVRMHNVFVLPGVPAVLRRKFERLAPLFRQRPLFREAFGLVADEALLAPALERVARDFPQVAVGSYPEPARVLVTFEGEDETVVHAARAAAEAATADVPRAD